MGFSFEGRYKRGVTKNGGGNDEFILPYGVVLTSFTPTFVPVVGYQETVGIDEKNRYESKEYPDDYYIGLTRPAFGGGNNVTTRIRITGPAEYAYNSVGIKV